MSWASRRTGQVFCNNWHRSVYERCPRKSKLHRQQEQSKTGINSRIHLVTPEQRRHHAVGPLASPGRYRPAPTLSPKLSPLSYHWPQPTRVSRSLATAVLCGRAFGPPLCGGIPPATPPRHHATLAPRRRRTVYATGRPPTSCREAARRDHGRGRPCACPLSPQNWTAPSITDLIVSAAPSIMTASPDVHPDSSESKSSGCSASQRPWQSAGSNPARPHTCPSNEDGVAGRQMRRNRICLPPLGRFHAPSTASCTK